MKAKTRIFGEIEIADDKIITGKRNDRIPGPEPVRINL